MKTPFPYFGGKSNIANKLWSILGDVNIYIEPFFGAGSILLSRPKEHKKALEIINDKDGMLINFWRSMKHDPDKTLYYADQPRFECDYNAIKAYVKSQHDDLIPLLEGDIKYYNPELAGYYWYVQSLTFGKYFISQDGSWSVVDKKLVKHKSKNAIVRQKMTIRLRGFFRKSQDKSKYAYELNNRLKDVMIYVGDYNRILTNVMINDDKSTAIIFDPPYVDESSNIDGDLYLFDTLDTKELEKFFMDNQDKSVVLFGYKNSYNLPDTYTVSWNANGGFSNQGDNQNRHKETIWFSKVLEEKAKEVFK